VGTFDDFAVFYSLLGRVHEESDFVDFIGQLLKRRFHATRTYSHDQRRNSTVESRGLALDLGRVTHCEERTEPFGAFFLKEVSKSL
jgi:hypothetical protein